MQNISIISALSVLFLIGMTFHVMAESDQYLQLKELYHEQRWNLEKEFKEKFQESSKKYQQEKQVVYHKIDSDHTLTSQQISQMLQNTFLDFVERQDDIKDEYTLQVDALNEKFAIKFEQFGEKMPLWVEKVRILWEQGKISDFEFANFLSFVINNDIIKLEQWIFSKYND
ncbi:hypothetical protein [Nitrosopumilus sp. S6]